MTTASISPPALATFSATPRVSSVGFTGQAATSLDCGSTPCWQAAHSSVAVGPYDVIQSTSAGFRFTDRDNSFGYDLSYGDFAGLPVGTAAGVEGRVTYDSTHKRWIAAFAEWDCNGTSNTGALDIAISDSTDPVWYWDVWTFGFGGFIPVTPSIGTSSDKIAVAVGRSALIGSGEPCFFFSNNTFSSESSFYVVDWAKILSLPSALTTHSTAFEAEAVPFIMARTEGGPPTGTIYGVDRTTDTGLDLTRLVQITGTVATSVSVAVTNLTGGGILGLDAPPISVARDGGNLVIGSDTSCTPPGGVTGPNPCARITRIASNGSTVVDDVDLWRDAYNLVSPSVAVGGDGTLDVVYNAFPLGPTGWAGVSSWTVHRAPGDPAGQFSAPALIALGTDTYVGGHGTGGMVGIVADPSDPHAVWQAYEYAGDTSGGWTTWISKLTTGVTAAPAGSVSIEAGRPATHAPPVYLSAVATSGTQLLISDLPTTSSGKLSGATLWQPTEHFRWDPSPAPFVGVADPIHVYLQFGDGAGNWSAVIDTSIRYPGAPSIIRRSGATRYDTAAAVAVNEYKPGVPVVYIATGLNFPDALAGAGAAGHKAGPILLVTPTLPLPPATASALSFLKPDKIILLGGTGAVSDSVRVALGTYTPSGAADVTRISGPSRYATAAAISAATYGSGVEEVLIATGANFPDALAGAAVAGRLGEPLLLVTASTLPAPTAAELARLKPHRITILGGTGAVGSAVAAALKAYTDGGVFRIAGANRYETAALIAANYSLPDPTLTFIATGLNFPDALAGAAAAGRFASPILLVAPTAIPTATKTALNLLRPSEMDVLGGTGAISAGVATSLVSYLGP